LGRKAPSPEILHTHAIILKLTKMHVDAHVQMHASLEDVHTSRFCHN